MPSRGLPISFLSSLANKDALSLLYNVQEFSQIYICHFLTGKPSTISVTLQIIQKWWVTIGLCQVTVHFFSDKSQCSIKSGRAFNICLVGCNVLHNPMNTAVQVENSFSDTNMSNHKCMCPCMDIIIRVKCQASNSIKSLIAFTNTTNKVNTNQDNPDEALTF